MFTFSILPEKLSFHVANFRRRGKKCTEIIKAREGLAKVLLVFIKYAKFVALSVPSLPIFLMKTLREDMVKYNAAWINILL